MKTSGLRWMSLMLLAPVPWAGRVWALPFLTALVPSERAAREQGRQHRSMLDVGRQLALQARRWLPRRDLVLVGDSGFSALLFLDAVRRSGITAITRLRLDAALYDPAPPRPPGTIGRPRTKGARLPTLLEVLTNKSTAWQALNVPGWYGAGERRIEVATATAVWRHAGLPVVPIRWVLVRDPEHRFAPQALLCTDLARDPALIVSWFVRRWCVEVTFQEARAHLGVETQRQWSDKAIARDLSPACSRCSRSSRCSPRAFRPANGRGSRPRRGTPNRSPPSATRSPRSGAPFGVSRLWQRRPAEPRAQNAVAPCQRPGLTRSATPLDWPKPS